MKIKNKKKMLPITLSVLLSLNTVGTLSYATTQMTSDDGTSETREMTTRETTTRETTTSETTTITTSRTVSESRTEYMETTRNDSPGVSNGVSDGGPREDSANRENVVDNANGAGATVVDENRAEAGAVVNNIHDNNIGFVVKDIKADFGSSLDLKAIAKDGFALFNAPNDFIISGDLNKTTDSSYVKGLIDVTDALTLNNGTEKIELAIDVNFPAKTPTVSNNIKPVYLKSLDYTLNYKPKNGEKDSTTSVTTYVYLKPNSKVKMLVKNNGKVVYERVFDSNKGLPSKYGLTFSYKTESPVTVETKVLEGNNADAGFAIPAVAVSSENGANAKAVVASGEVFADALSISPYAAHNVYPILLVKKNEIPQSVSDYIAKDSIKTDVVVGGENTISKSVFTDLKSAKERVAGANRYETSVAATMS